MTNAGDHLYVVSNAGCRHKDIPLMAARAEVMKAEGSDITLEFIEDRGLVALQGKVRCVAVLMVSEMSWEGVLINFILTKKASNIQTLLRSYYVLKPSTSNQH